MTEGQAPKEDTCVHGWLAWNLILSAMAIPVLYVLYGLHRFPGGLVNPARFTSEWATRWVAPNVCPGFPGYLKSSRRPPVTGEEAFLASTPLFDVTSWPPLEETCSHCAGPDDVAFCCGVCVFEHRTCEQFHLGKAVGGRALRELTKLGYPLGELTPCELFHRIKGRTLWFMGDSQTWFFYIAVECFLHPFAVDLRRRNVTDDPHMKLLLRPVTVSKERYALCLHLVESTRVCVVRADDAYTMTRDIWPTLRRLGDMTRDVFVWNIGLHVHLDGSYLAQLEHAANYIEANRAWLPHLVWMDTPPQHFDTKTGAFKRRLGRACVPIQDKASVDAGGAWNSVAAPLVPLLGEAHLATYAHTVPFYYAHLKTDCTHFCSPGPYQLWTYLLNQLMEEWGLGNPVPPAMVRRLRGGRTPQVWLAEQELQPGA